MHNNQLRRGCAGCKGTGVADLQKALAEVMLEVMAGAAKLEELPHIFGGLCTWSDMRRTQQKQNG